MAIDPTPGRMLYYRPCNADNLCVSPEPLAATIAAVLPDGLLNISVLDHEGRSHAKQRVPLVQPGAEPPKNRSYCEWMPFQVGQSQAVKEAQASVPPKKDDKPGYGRK